MKHHYMHISTTCVRIELIPEDTEEKLLLQELAQAGPQDPTLDNLFRKAMGIYHPQAILSARTFMEFPRVALCSFQLHETPLTISG